MAIQTQFERIEAARNDIRNKFVELALVENSAKLDELAMAAKGIVNCGNVDVEVREGETFTVPAGYHSGSGTVRGVAGGGNYTLQAKTVTPTKALQSITPDEGKYGLSSVTVNAIPEAYQDVTSVTASAADVLTGKVIVDATGRVTAGTMTNNGAVSKVIDTSVENKGYTIPQGYHNGKGTVTVSLEEKSATPSEAAQTVVPSSGKVLSKVTVNPIPAKYKNTDGVDTAADKILSGEVVITSAGKITGTMPVYRDLDIYIGVEGYPNNPDNIYYLIPQGYHDGRGYVQIDPEEKTATPTKSKQNITPSKGKVLYNVVVNPIPDKYQDVQEVSATADKVLIGSKFVDSSGAVIEGTMINRGKFTQSFDGLTTTSYTIPAGYHDGTGSISLTNDIEGLLAAI